MKQTILLLTAIVSFSLFAKVDSGDDMTTIQVKVGKQTESMTMTKTEYAFLWRWFQSLRSGTILRPSPVQPPIRPPTTLEFQPGSDGVWRLSEFMKDPHATQGTKDRIRKILADFKATPPASQNTNVQKAEAEEPTGSAQ